MYFNFLLDALFGPREVLHAMECSVCGQDRFITLMPKPKSKSVEHVRDVITSKNLTDDQ